MLQNETDTMTASVKVGLLGVGFDANSTFRRGPAAAPPAIRAALGSASGNAYSETGVRVWPSESVLDHGDLDVPDEKGTRGPIDVIERGVGQTLDDTPRLVVLGGDHTVTYPVVRAFAAKHGRISLLHFDAHPDLYPDFEGNRFSHACPMARILEDGLVERLVQVGIRSFTPAQHDAAKRHNVEVIPAFSAGPVPALAFDTPVYISMDVDALDPGYAPGVSHPEPGGLSVRQMLETVAATRTPYVVGGDVVELNPKLDRDGGTAIAAAKLVRELLGRVILDGRAD